MTVAELNRAATAYSRRIKREREEDTHRLYNLASLIRAMVWEKHAPSYDKCFGNGKSSAGEMSDEQLLRQVEALNRLFGGEVE